MDQRCMPTAKPTLEEVRQRFEQWRERRKARTPIPESLSPIFAEALTDTKYNVSGFCYLKTSFSFAPGQPGMVVGSLSHGTARSAGLWARLG